MGNLITWLVTSLDQVTNNLTKPLLRKPFHTLQFMLEVHDIPFSSLRGSDSDKYLAQKNQQITQVIQANDSVKEIE